MIAQIEDAGFEAVVRPDWSNGWTRAGSWQRDVETSGEYEPMIAGRVCCGCGREIVGSRKALCVDCFKTWRPRHREGYQRALPA